MQDGTLITCGRKVKSMECNNAVLKEQIMREVNRTAYITCDADASVLAEMLNEINLLGYSFSYLAEFIQYKIGDKAARIVERYIDCFCCEGPRGYLVGKLDINKRDNALLILRLYQHFQESDEYIAAPGTPAPAHIYTRYDNAFFRLKTNQLDQELLAALCTPRDICYLPLTTKKLAQRRIFEISKIIGWYLNSESLSLNDVGLPDDSNLVNYPPLSYFKRQLKFIAVSCLQYYPSQEARLLLADCAVSKDKDLATVAKKSLHFLDVDTDKERIVE